VAQGAFPAEAEHERRRASAARRVRVAAAFGVVGVAIAATAATVLLLAPPPERKAAPHPRLARATPPPPVRLDDLRVRRGHGYDYLTRTGARATRVVGVGTGHFLARRGSARGASPLLDVDGTANADDATNELASDAEVRRDLAALARENARIEAQLRGLGGDGTGTGHLIWPVRGPITSPFGQRWGRLHAGIDIGVHTGTDVHAADSGRVVISGWVGGYGNYVCIKHTGSLTTCYGHNSRLGVHVGDAVRQGATISQSGCTGHCYGPHVHFETRLNGRPVDPMRFLR
jgi:murein DD-endopeptidase MepM/ murein hydrolase activator NlpD